MAIRPPQIEGDKCGVVRAPLIVVMPPGPSATMGAARDEHRMFMMGTNKVTAMSSRFFMPCFRS